MAFSSNAFLRVCGLDFRFFVIYPDGHVGAIIIAVVKWAGRSLVDRLAGPEIKGSRCPWLIRWQVEIW